MFAYVMAAMRSLIRNDSAQDAFEYLLVVGAVSVAVILAITTPVGTTVVNAIVDATCGAIDTIPVISGTLVCPA